MSTVVNTNVRSISAQHAITVNNRAVEKSITQLSTGMRINTAADDAAGLAIGNKMTAQIRSLDMAVRNSNDGISMLQTADGATSEITIMLIRMRELAIQSANDTNSQPERDALQIEFLQLQEQSTSTINNTSWNGMKLLKGEAGSAGQVKFQVGANSTDSIALPLTNMNSDDVASAVASSVTISDRTNALAAIGLIDKAMVQIDGERSQWGATINRLTYAADNASNVSMHTSVSRSRTMDTDYAQATAEMARSLILNQAGTAMLSQANQNSYYVLALLS
jgi:flagellin